MHSASGTFQKLFFDMLPLRHSTTWYTESPGTLSSPLQCALAAPAQHDISTPEPSWTGSHQQAGVRSLQQRSIMSMPYVDLPWRI